MTAALFAFWVLAIGVTAAAVMVISARNAVHAVLWLILAFFNAAGLFVLAGAEFLAMVLVIVYVGAVAVLFMFVVMMLDLEVARAREGLARYLPIGLLIAAIILVELAVVAGAWREIAEAGVVVDKPPPADAGVTNAEALGRILYTDYVYAFQAAGLILLCAIVGAIALTLRARPGAKKQSVSAQLARARTDTITLVDQPSREGV